MTSPSRSVVIHGHFYQPPREDPWTGAIPRQPSAAPYHDWNERIEAECYAPVVRSRVRRDGEPDRTINSLEWMSFNFGPTLMVWLEEHAPDTYGAILDADRESAERLGGYGNAIAMPYHHPILPLSTEPDRRTEIRWGIADFRRRFGRDPEGMWLPETAVDDATLEALAAEGIRFTILAPHQVDPVPDDGRPGRYVTAEGREIAVFVYDGGLSHGVAFGDLLEDGVRWAEVMAGSVEDELEVAPPLLRSMATDGETFGHHHEFGEMGLAKAILELRAHAEVRVENFASFLAREGAGQRIGIVAPSAWSCAHGVDRWRADCGCRADPSADTRQDWRGPLREALTWLAERLHEVYEAEGRTHFEDVWAARDAYGDVVAEQGTGLDSLEIRGGARGRGVKVPQSARGLLGDRLTGRALELLEMERNALRMFTSCAWFFDDVGGLEPKQVLAYAARALELAGRPAEALREGFVERLGEAVSNDREVGTAADVFEAVAGAGLDEAGEVRVQGLRRATGATSSGAPAAKAVRSRTGSKDAATE